MACLVLSMPACLFESTCVVLLSATGAAYKNSVRCSCPLHYGGGEDVAGKLNL